MGSQKDFFLFSYQKPPYFNDLKKQLWEMQLPAYFVPKEKGKRSALPL